MEKRYGRAQYVRDAIALGLPLHLAFSRAALRRQRDRLMQLHHPDRGGSDVEAQHINKIYTRMMKWLDERGKAPPFPPDRDFEAVEEEPLRPSSALRKAAKATLWAATLAASSYLAIRRGKRR